jgi:methionyl-tRNA synthetase
MNKPFTPPANVKDLLQNLKRPKTAVITAGMPYANGPVHLGHLVGALVPPDVMARYLRMMIGKDNVLFVSGTDDHGSTSEVAALKNNQPVREFIDNIHAKQKLTMDRYGISLNVYAGTSRPDTFPIHKWLTRKENHQAMV